MTKTVVGTKAVKSAGRALDLLEYLNTQRAEASIGDIVRDLGYPLSSTSELVHYLAERGYISCDRQRRRYRLTARAAVLGSSVAPSLFRRGRLLARMDRISKACGELVVIGMRFGTHAQFIHVVQATKPFRIFVTPSHRVPILQTAIGRLLLSAMPELQARALIQRINSEIEPEKRVPYALLATEFEGIREQGYSMSVDTAEAGKGMVAVHVPEEDGDQMALGIGGPSDVIRAHHPKFARILTSVVDDCPDPDEANARLDLSGLSTNAHGNGQHAGTRILPA
jgi:DNA-binding IclR family transcriptional regulator